MTRVSLTPALPTAAQKTAVTAKPRSRKPSIRHEDSAAPTSRACQTSRSPLISVTRSRRITGSRKPTPSIFHSTADTLFTWKPAVKRDIQDYISGTIRYKDQRTHELLEPTGTRFVYYLAMSPSEAGVAVSTREMREDMQEVVEVMEEKDSLGLDNKHPSRPDVASNASSTGLFTDIVPVRYTSTSS